jgi:hypothetical protein
MKIINRNFIVTTLLVLSAVALRMVFNKLQMWNFSPIAAMALFAGYSYKDKRFSFLVPILAMLISDVFIGLHSGMFVVYSALCLATIIGILISGKGVTFVVGGSLFSSLVFYLITNLVIWDSPKIYPLSWEGQLQSYIAALPFFQSSLLSDLIFTTILFGIYQLLRQRAMATERS